MSETALRTDAAEALKEHGIALLIDAVAARSAKQAVHETFFLLGVDLKDPEHVRSTRDVITRMRDDFDKEQRRKEAWGKGFVFGVATLVAGIALTAVTSIASGHSWKFWG